MINNKIELSEILGKNTKQDERIFTRQAINVFEFYLTGVIEASEDYIQWFDTIRHASETDVIKIYINSPGGDVFTAIQLIRALKETDATVVISVEGMCASAATMIMLCGDSFEVSEHSSFMIHTYQGGTYGKGNELHSQALFEREWSVNMMHSMYDGFLTTEEIDKVIDGADMWMDGEEVIRRLRLKKQAIEDADKAQEAEKADKAAEPQEAEKAEKAAEPQEAEKVVRKRGSRRKSPAKSSRDT